MVELVNTTKIEIINLFRGNYFSQYHVREMAKLISKSHVSLLPHLKNFEKENILKVKNMGKSRVYSLNLENNQVREFLSISEKIRTINFLTKELLIKKLYDEFINFSIEGCLILFGSYATLSHNKESDIDLLYIGDLKENQKNKLNNLGKTYNKEVHLISMNQEQFKEQLSKQATLIKEIINNHIILYNHDLFINEVWRNYNGRRER